MATQRDLDIHANEAPLADAFERGDARRAEVDARVKRDAEIKKEAANDAGEGMGVAGDVARAVASDPKVTREDVAGLTGFAAIDRRFAGQR